MSYYYSVHKGFHPGIYATWEETKVQIDGHKGAKFRKFTNLEEAKYFLQTGKIIEKQAKITLQPSGNLEVKETKTQKNNKILVSNNKTFINSQIRVWTDGASSNNGKSNCKAGIGVFFGKNHPLNVSKRFNNRPSNQRAELYAIIVALENIYNSDKYKNSHNKPEIIIFSDSMYSINCITKWFYGW